MKKGSFGHARKEATRQLAGGDIRRELTPQEKKAIFHYVYLAEILEQTRPTWKRGSSRGRHFEQTGPTWKRGSSRGGNIIFSLGKKRNLVCALRLADYHRTSTVIEKI
ncbi:hypothetical protein KP509_22G031500 [Ceratopteris richardii]|uniref:Uncharacterized protein n=1 Tax=Ceratopteris richardii TaxID=49495 RepID=A0A8T2S3R8_CERRI|nr:hypothetical protein KP509_22G031500 [Ceratopteris richardii]